MKRLFLDLETTGTSPGVHAIHQLSGAIEIDGQIETKFNFRMKPWEGAEIDPVALEKCNVTEEEITGEYYAPQEEVFKTFLNILNRYFNSYDKNDKAFLIGYNVGFDKGFFVDFFIRNGNEFLFSYIWGSEIDVMSLAGRVLQYKRHLLENFQLSTVCAFVGIEVDPENLHDAEYDIYLTRELFYKVDGDGATISSDPQNVVVINGKDINEEKVVITDDEINAAQKDIDESYPIPPTNSELPTATIQMEIKENNSSEVYKTLKDWSERVKGPAQSMGEVLHPMKSEEEPNPNVIDVKHIEVTAEIKSPISDDIANQFLTGVGNQPISAGGEEKQIKSLKKVSDISHVITFGGKHKGKSIEEILKIDANYIVWLHDNTIQGYVFDNQIVNQALSNQQKQKAEFFANKNPKYRGPGSKHHKGDYPGSDTALDHMIDCWDNPMDDMPF